MSGGSWLNHGTDSIGTTPGYMGPWEKLQLGWLDYKTVPVRHGHARSSSARPTCDEQRPAAQAARRPAARRAPSRPSYNTPHSGTAEWWSGFGDNLNSTLTRTVDLTGARRPASVSAWVQGDLEEDYDYLYGEVSTDGGATLDRRSATPIDGDASPGPRRPGTCRPTRARTSSSASASPPTVACSSEAFLDDIAVTVDGVTGHGRRRRGRRQRLDRRRGFTDHQRHHLAAGAGLLLRREPRLQRLRRRRCKTGPYNFGLGNTKPDWVERFPYQNGMLVWFANGEYADNNTVGPPRCAARCSRSTPARRRSCSPTAASLLGNRRQPFDATFGQEKTDAVTFHRNGVADHGAVAAGDPDVRRPDPNRYWTADNPWASTKVAGSGTSMTVAKTTDGGNELQVKVRFQLTST